MHVLPRAPRKTGHYEIRYFLHFKLLDCIDVRCFPIFETIDPTDSAIDMGTVVLATLLLLVRQV